MDNRKLGRLWLHNRSMDLISQAFAGMTALHLSILEKILRPIAVYVAIIVMLRVFGKRQLAQLNPFDLTVLLCLANTLQNAIIGDDNSVTGGIVGAFSLLAINYATVRFFFRHRSLDQIASGEPTVLIEHGKIIHDALAKEMLTEGELTIAAHRQGFSSLDDIDRCVLEPGGVFFMCSPDGNAGDKRLKEVLERLDGISVQIRDLEKNLPKHV